MAGEYLLQFCSHHPSFSIFDPFPYFHLNLDDSKWPPPFENPQSIILQEDPEIQIVRHKEKSSCIPKKNEIYWVDNCWEIFYGKVVKRRRFFSNWYQRIQPDLLFSFLSSPRSVHHNFKKDSVNIVVHVRRNDAGRNRRIPEEVCVFLPYFSLFFLFIFSYNVRSDLPDVDSEFSRYLGRSICCVPNQLIHSSFKKVGWKKTSLLYPFRFKVKKHGRS